MVYKNIEIHNASELIDLGDGVTWKRVPGDVCDKLERAHTKGTTTNSTGVELRFVLKGDDVKITMACLDAPEKGVDCQFHIFYGSMQAGWTGREIHKIIGNEPTEFTFTRCENLEKLKKISTEAGYDFDPEVVRVIFDCGHIKIMDVVGDVEPPKKEQLPSRVMLSYGSSITHGSSAMDMSHSWASITAHRLNADCRNLGMAGSCAIEKEMIDYIAQEGNKGNWDLATLELGINVLEWENEKIYDRVTYAIDAVAGKNPDKPIFVISPFYCGEDYESGIQANKWRRIIAEVVDKLGYKNVHYKSGLEFIDNMSYLTTDETHPNIYGVQQIADRMTDFIKTNVCFGK